VLQLIRLSDPRPAYCSACHNAPEGRYVDFDAAHDGGSFLQENGVVYLEGSDDLHICEGCMRRGAEELALKPDVQQRQLREIRRLEAAAEHWKEYARSLEATLEERPERAPRQVRRPKAAV
jgi:hypothetical protein